MNRGVIVRVAGGIAAAGLVALSSTQPLWTLTMRAPQYPKGLRLQAYGSGMTGDLRELNILNHYIGMPPIEAPPLETALYPVGIGLLVLLCLLSPLHRWLYRSAAAATLAMPVLILTDLQWRLYEFGHTLDPHAPIRLKPFTPLVLGESAMGNFHSTGMIALGTFSLLIAGALLMIANRAAHRRGPVQTVRTAPGAVAAALALVVFGYRTPPVAAQSLQQRIDAAKPGGTVLIDGGVHYGAIAIHGPLTVVGKNNPVIDGNGIRSIVNISGDDVVFRGFIVRNSGRDVTDEAAGIKASGNRHRIEGNTVRDVYFGIHVGAGEGLLIQGNDVAPGEQHGARPGHGISVWHVQNSQIQRNRVSNARDGIYLSFTDGVSVSANVVTRCRYGIHSMYSQNAVLLDNRLTENLLGAALMMSERLVLRGNRIERHRQGSAAYGILLKDIGDLLAEDNVIVANRIGIYAEAVPGKPSQSAILANNVIAGNDVGLALQSNATLTVTRNRIADNLTDVRALGRQLSPRTQWSRDGRGNSWSQYRGFDADRDGIGDVPHRVDDAMDALIRRSPLAQAFLYTPAHLAIEAAARMFPIYRQAPILVDERPLIADRYRGRR